MWSWSFIIFIMVFVSTAAAFLEWLLPELRKKTEIDFAAIWIKFDDSNYRTVIEWVDGFYRRRLNQLFGREIISLRAFAGAGLLSFAGFSGFLFVKTFFLYHRGNVGTFWGAVEEGIQFLFWDLGQFATWRGFIVAWGCTLLSIALTRQSARQMMQRAMGWQLLMLWANIVLVCYLGLIPTGAYYRANLFPNVIINPFEPLNYLEMDYYNWQILLLYLPLGLACALPVIFRAGVIVTAIIAKSFGKPAYKLLNRILLRLADTRTGILMLIAVLFDTFATVLEAFLSWIEHDK